MNYGDLPEEFSTPENSRIVILPIPYDETSTWGKGADKGPEALIAASANMELYDIETDFEPYTLGIYTSPPLTEKKSPEAMVEAGRKAAASFLEQGKFVVTLGGEHSVTEGPFLAHLEKHPEMSVLQIDAHSDLREEYHGSRHNHACIMARVKERCPIMQVGIRSMDSSEKPGLDRSRVVFAHEMQDGEGWMDKALSRLTDEVYITIDLDCFDSSIMPSTGTPEPGGLSWYQAVRLLKRVASEKRIVGFDIVELAPNPRDKAPDFLASKLLYTLLAYRFSPDQEASVSEEEEREQERAE